HSRGGHHRWCERFYGSTGLRIWPQRTEPEIGGDVRRWGHLVRPSFEARTDYPLPTKLSRPEARARAPLSSARQYLRWAHQAPLAGDVCGAGWRSRQWETRSLSARGRTFPCARSPPTKARPATAEMKPLRWSSSG